MHVAGARDLGMLVGVPVCVSRVRPTLVRVRAFDRAIGRIGMSGACTRARVGLVCRARAARRVERWTRVCCLEPLQRFKNRHERGAMYTIHFAFVSGVSTTWRREHAGTSDCARKGIANCVLASRAAAVAARATSRAPCWPPPSAPAGRRRCARCCVRRSWRCRATRRAALLLLQLRGSTGEALREGGWRVHTHAAAAGRSPAARTHPRQGPPRREHERRRAAVLDVLLGRRRRGRRRG